LSYSLSSSLCHIGAISKFEYEQLVSSDSRYRYEASRVDDEITLTKVESAFGEIWKAKKERILGTPDCPPSGYDD
jgi:hypothetical protein